MTRTQLEKNYNSFTKKSTEDLFKSIQLNASVTYLSAPKVGKNITLRHMIKVIKKVDPAMSKTINSYAFVFISLDPHNSNPVSSLVDELNYFLPEKDKLKPSTGWREISESIPVILSSDKKKIIIVISNANLLYKDLAEFGKKLYPLNRAHPTEVQFMFLTNEELPQIEEIATDSRDIAPLILSNVVTFPLLSEEDARNLLLLRASDIDKTLTDKETETILKLSGGHPGFMLIFLRELFKTGNIISEVKDQLENDEIKLLFMRIWGSFSESTQENLLKDPKYSNNHLKNTGLRNKDGKWFCEAFGNFIQELKTKSKTSPTDKLENKLTWQELKVYEILKKNQGNTVTKEDIAKHIWGDAWIDKYSEWAIAQIVSHIRKKAQEDTELNIRSVPSEGYCMTAE